MRQYLLHNSSDCTVHSYDVVVIGAGLAGLYCALNLPETIRVAILTKGTLSESNSDLAQGGIAVTLPGMDPKGHFEDTLEAGSCVNDCESVAAMISDGSQHIEKLSNWGVTFDKDQDGNLSLTKEGGHSIRRVVHSKDTTGRAVMSLLRARALQSPNISIFENTNAAELIVDPAEEEVVGLLSYRNGAIELWAAGAVVLATGGLGHLYQNTTNSGVVSGDGIAMAIRAGVTVADMEMVQFHPTAFAVKDGDRHFLISEALRGEGGILRDLNGQSLMEGVHPQGDLAPRDIVSREIFKVMQHNNWPHVYLDVTHLNEGFLKSRFPNIFDTCLSFGINIAESMIPVCPVEHYSMGGVHTDLMGQTSLKGLFAIGEVAHTGVHGANRLASNSLLEALVYSFRAATKISEMAIQRDPIKSPLTHKAQKWCHEVLSGDIASQLHGEVKNIISQGANIYRRKTILKSALVRLQALDEKYSSCVIGDVAGLRAINALTLGKAIVSAALDRPMSLGAHQMEETLDD